MFYINLIGDSMQDRETMVGNSGGIPVGNSFGIPRRGNRYKIAYSAVAVKSRCVAGIINIAFIINSLCCSWRRDSNSRHSAPNTGQIMEIICNFKKISAYYRIIYRMFPGAG